MKKKNQLLLGLLPLVCLILIQWRIHNRSISQTFKKFDLLSVSTTAVPRTSRRSLLSPGMELLENVCIERPQKKRETLKFLSFDENATSLVSSLVKGQPSWAYWMTHTEGRTLDDLPNNTAWVPDDTLFTVQILLNPGHCLNDLIFPIALDVWNRSLTTYPHFLSTFFSGLPSTYQPDWCYQMMNATGIIDTSRFDKQLQHSPSLCFERLLVPTIGAHRFPVSWSDTDTIQSLKKKHWRKHFKQLAYSPGLYPVEALELLQQRAIRGTGLSFEPHVVSKDTDVPILFYNRENHKRYLRNSVGIARELERRYMAKVHLVGKEWDEYDFQKQAALFNEYPRIIVVHGAHQANQIFCRPGTKVVEIMPFQINPMPDVKAGSRNEVKRDIDWYGQAGWFSSFTRRLGQEHFTWGPRPGSPFETKSFNATISDLVSFVANRFELTGRVDESTGNKTIE